MRIRYGRWTGGQDPLRERPSAREVLAGLADDLMAGAAPEDAVRRLRQRGLPGATGLDALRRRVEEARRRELGLMGLEGPLRSAEQRLADIVGLERTAIDLSDDPRSWERAAHLDALPDDVAGRIGHLQRHDWEDGAAAAAFDDLVDELRRDVAEATYGRLAGALGSLGTGEVERARGLLGELNDLAARAERGEDVTGDYAAFRERYGDLLPPAGTLQELLAETARRMAALSALLAGLDPVRRERLARMADQLLGDDPELARRAAELRATLRRRHPELGWDRAVPGAGAEGEGTESLSATVDWLGRLREFDELAGQLRQDYPGARLEDVDREALRRLVGDAAAEELTGLRDVERVLEEAGAARRRHGRLVLTPHGIRLLGERCLARIFERTDQGAAGGHRAARAGGDGELTGATRPLRFGDDFRVDVVRTVANAVLREARQGRRPHGAPTLDPRDFALAEAETRVRAVTALLLDMSFSMPLRGNWGPAKQVALALHALVGARFPEDRLFLVGFSDYARRLRPADLLSSGWERVYGTNMQHALQLTRRLLAGYPAAERQVVMITDGEPTAHLEGGQARFSWPPERRTLERTLAEAGRLARSGATLNVFLLDHDPQAAAFVERMAAVAGGRVLSPDPGDLGRLVVRDFLRRRAA